jgi:hypothetical protein
MADGVAAALAPRIAIYESEDVSSLCREHLGLPDLATLLKPWQAAGVERVNLRTSTFESITAPVFPLHIDEVSEVREEGPWEREGGWLDSMTADINAKLDDWLADVPGDRELVDCIRRLRLSERGRSDTVVRPLCR